MRLFPELGYLSINCRAIKNPRLQHQNIYVDNHIYRIMLRTSTVRYALHTEPKSRYLVSFTYTFL